MASLRVFSKKFLVAVSWEFRKGNICTVWKETLRSYLKNDLVQKLPCFLCSSVSLDRGCPLCILSRNSIYLVVDLDYWDFYNSLALMKLRYDLLTKRVWNLKKDFFLAILHVSKEWVVRWTEPEFLCQKPGFIGGLKMTRRFYNRFCTSLSNKFKKVFFPALTTSELQVAMLRTMIKKKLWWNTCHNYYEEVERFHKEISKDIFWKCRWIFHTFAFRRVITSNKIPQM